MDLVMMKDQLAGLETRGKELADEKDLFVKAQGLDEEVAKAQQEVEAQKKRLTGLKATKKHLKNQKREAVEPTAKALAEKIGEVLPVGVAMFEAGESGVFIGWDGPNGKVPYDGLSGGQKVTFDAALCHALDAKLLVVEAAELDTENMRLTLEKLAEFPGQVIVNTCHPIPKKDIPKKFKVTMIGGAE